MVTISGFKKQQNKEGKEFLLLEVQGEVEAVQSMKTGRFYLSIRRAYMVCTFSEAVAKTLIGKQLPGCIARVETESYQYLVPETGELITLMHRWEYQPEEAAVPAASARPVAV